METFSGAKFTILQGPGASTYNLVADARHNTYQANQIPKLACASSTLDGVVNQIS